MKKVLLVVCLLLSASSAIAQTPEVFQARANQDPDHRWTDSVNSNRFTVWYSRNAGDCANLTTANAQTALNELEAIYDVFVHRDGFHLLIPPMPPTSTRWAFTCCGTVQTVPTHPAARAAGGLAVTIPPLAAKGMLSAEP